MNKRTIGTRALAPAMAAAALAQSRALIDYETVKAWDGKLPVQMLGNAPLPFLKLESGVAQ